MRVAVKIAYDGAAFFGHQRQPDVPTVEGECLRALRGSRIISDPTSAFFRSASRTDRGVSAIGNVIAFNTELRAEAVLGAFNDRARNVWAWAYAITPDDFHPRSAVERWYRYHLFEDLPPDRLRTAAKAFVGVHNFQTFTSDPLKAPFALNRIEVAPEGGVTCVDVFARRFQRGLVRRIVAAILGHARGEIDLTEIRRALAGAARDFGLAPAEPLFLMNVRYEFPFVAVLKPKVEAEWRAIESEAGLRLRFTRALADAVRESCPSDR